MDTRFERALTRLEHGDLLRIQRGLGQSIAVFEGLVWITQDGDARDIFVMGGETFTLDAHGPAIVYALQPSRVLVLDALHNPEGRPARGWRDRIVDAVAALFGRKRLSIELHHPAAA